MSLNKKEIKSFVKINKINFMTKKQILDNFGSLSLSFGKKKMRSKNITEIQRKNLLKKVMKIKNEKGVSLKKAWSIVKK